MGIKDFTGEADLQSRQTNIEVSSASLWSPVGDFFIEIIIDKTN
jgi:hypothetical protein